MSYKQIVTPNLGITTTPGWCLKAVRQAFGAPALYPTATAGWNNAQFKHHDMNFSGCYVPIWFSLAKEPAGHVAIMAPDGSVYSTTSSKATTFTHHANFNALIKAYAPYNPLTYLGWSEDVCSVKVVEFVPDVIKATADEVRQAYLDMLERPADDGGLAHYMNYPIDFVRADIAKSDECKTLQLRKQAEAIAAAQIPVPVTPPEAPQQVITTEPVTITTIPPVVATEPLKQPIIKPSFSDSWVFKFINFIVQLLDKLIKIK